jgi:polyisoprenoid-binding protein YceI
MNKLLVLLFIVFPTVVFSQTTWKPVSSEISFKIKNAGITVTGRFTGLKADLRFSPDKLNASHLKASVEVATIKTGIDKRDEDLQEEKYFNADKYKLIEMESVKLDKKGAQYSGLFKVTIKGVTKQVEIPFDFKQTGSEAEFTGSFTINRRDYGVGGKTLTMSDDAVVSIDIKAKS